MSRKGFRDPRATSLALLCLIAHALFVCVTHHHANAVTLASTGVNITASGESDSRSVPETGGDAQCVSCRLHGSFISDDHSSSVLVEPARDLLTRDIAFADPHSRPATLLVFGRAPPLA